MVDQSRRRWLAAALATGVGVVIGGIANAVQAQVSPLARPVLQRVLLYLLTAEGVVSLGERLGFVLAALGVIPLRDLEINPQDPPTDEQHDDAPRDMDEQRRQGEQFLEAINELRDDEARRAMYDTLVDIQNNADELALISERLDALEATINSISPSADQRGISSSGIETLQYYEVILTAKALRESPRAIEPNPATDDRRSFVCRMHPFAEFCRE